MTKKQHYMRWEERQQLEAMWRNHIPVSEIARQLGFCRQTIYDELKRGAYIHTCPYWDEVRYSAVIGNTQTFWKRRCWEYRRKEK